MRRAFTMIELLVVIVIIAVIPAITLPGLVDDRINNHAGVVWGNSIRSAAPVDTVDATPDKLLVVDWSHFGSGTGILNHGKAAGVIYGVSLPYFRQSIVGGNKLVIDGHVKWATPDQTGRNGEHVNAGPRYSHYSNLRPYYW